MANRNFISADTNALITLKSFSRKLSKQQYKTLKGQIHSGDTEGALKGLNKILGKSKTN